MFNGGPVHMVGIGGSGMASLAEMLLGWGVRVSGSDRERGDGFWRLYHAGARLCLGHDAHNLPAGCRMVIHSAAVPQDNPELKTARQLNIPTLKYAQVLGSISKEFRTIAVAGTHGKTTVTAMLARALHDAYIPCSFVVGGDAPQLRGLPRPPKAPFFVTEACEFDRSFLNLRRSVAVVTNIEPDHLDCYGSKEFLYNAFSDFIKGVEEFVVTNADDEICRELLKHTGVKSVTFGYSKDADFRILYADHEGNLTILHRGTATEINLRLIGEHNCRNAACAFAVLVSLGISPQIVAVSLSTFQGVVRRLQIINHKRPFIIDDYAHHPTEVKAVIRSVRAAFGGRVLFVFQPHQHLRLHSLFDEFVDSFSQAEDLLLMPVYSVREGDDARRLINHIALAVALQTKGLRVHTAVSNPEALQLLLRTFDEWDVICFMGAGDIYRLARRIAACASRSTEVRRVRHAG